MGRPAGWMKQFTGRDAMRSPGAPSHRREIERQFWLQIAVQASWRHAIVYVQACIQQVSVV